MKIKPVCAAMGKSKRRERYKRRRRWGKEK